MGEKSRNLMNETHFGQLGGEMLPEKEYRAKEREMLSKEKKINSQSSDVIPTKRMGKDLTQSDKDELAILRQQIKETEAVNVGEKGMGRAYEASEASRIYPGSEKSNQLKELTDQALRKLAEQKAQELQGVLPKKSNNEKTQIVQPLPVAQIHRKKGLLARIFGK